MVCLKSLDIELIESIDKKLRVVSSLMKEGKVMQYNDQMKNRVKRIEGQLRGTLNMMEENKDCNEVIPQLTAARTAINRTIGVIVCSNLVECVMEAAENGVLKFWVKKG